MIRSFNSRIRTFNIITTNKNKTTIAPTYKTKNNIAMKSTFNVKNNIVVITKIKTKNNIEWIGFLLIITNKAQIKVNNVIIINIIFGLDMIFIMYIK